MMHKEIRALEMYSSSERGHSRVSARRRSLGSFFFVVLTAIVVLRVAWYYGALLPFKNRHATSQAPLRFTTNGTFQIAVFEDLHFGENAWDTWGPQQDVKTLRVMNAILDHESAQLVVLNGDLITGENTFRENSTSYVDMIVAPLVDRGLPWASAYGNHDSAYNLSRQALLMREQRHTNSRTFSMVSNPHAGVSNYFLPVFPSDGSEVPCLLLWFFDSRGGESFQELGPDGGQIAQQSWVHQSVVDWFIESNAHLKRRWGGHPIPSLAFVHIPTNASQAFQTGVGVDSHYQPGINDDYVLAQQAQGWCKNGSYSAGCWYGGQDVPFMQALAHTAGLLAVFSAHDHGDSWCYRWAGLLPGMTVAGNGLHLCFGQHSGYGGYGTWVRGSRQIHITEEALHREEIETWIRTEKGNVVGGVVLNSTYGRDYYAATPDEHT